MTRTPTPQEWAHAAACHRRGEPAGQLAEALGVAERAVLERARAEQWDRRACRPSAIVGAPICPVCHVAQDPAREPGPGGYTGRVVYAHPPRPCVAPILGPVAPPLAATRPARRPRACETLGCGDSMEGRASNARFCARCSPARLRDHRTRHRGLRSCLDCGAEVEKVPASRKRADRCAPCRARRDKKIRREASARYEAKLRAQLAAVRAARAVPPGAVRAA